MLTPLGCLFSPVSPQPPTSYSNPLKCSGCANYINQFIRMDRQNHMWWCPFCEEMNFLPENFQLPEKGCPDEEIPVEIRPSAEGTIDYVLPEDISVGDSPPFVAVYIVDRYQHTDCIEDREFENLKSSIAESIRDLPKGTLVAVVTYADTVEVAVPSRNDTVVFLPGVLFGDNYDFSKIFKDAKLLNGILSKLLISKRSASWKDSEAVASGILSENSQKLVDFVHLIRPVLTGTFKPPRAAGLAYLVASLLLQSSFSRLLGKISIFASGPATTNPGMIVDANGPIRSHHDVANFKAPHFVSALRFYQTLSYIASGYQIEDACNAVYSASGKLTDYAVSENTPKFSFDIYTGSLDQVGVYEMRHLAKSATGTILLSDTFLSTQFKMTVLANTAKIAEEKHNCKLTVCTSSGIKIMKAVSHGTELQSSYQAEKFSSLHHDRISDTVTQFDSTLKKRNFTNQWFLGSLDGSDTVALYFEMDTVPSSSLLNLNGPKEVYIQFQTRWWDMKLGKNVLQLTTLKKPTTLAVLAANQVKMSDGTYRLVNPKSSILKEKKLLESFDYKAWMVLFTRLLISKIDTTIGYESFDEVVKDVDLALIRLTTFFGGIKEDVGSSHNPYENLKVICSIDEHFRELPSFSYSLRRNPQLIRIFNSSPDETAYYHHMFNRTNTELSCDMIHPSLYKVFNGELQKILLDETSIAEKEPTFFVLDSIFNLIVYYSTTQKLPLHNSNNDHLVYGESTTPELNSVLDLVKSDLLAKRNIIPRIVLTQTGHSQARFLAARLYPVEDKAAEVTQEPRWWYLFGRSTASKTLMTDDVSVNKYYNELLEKVKDYSIGGDY